MSLRNIWHMDIPPREAHDVVWQGLKTDPPLTAARDSHQHYLTRALGELTILDGRQIGKARPPAPRIVGPQEVVPERCVCGRVVRAGRRTCSHGACAAKMKGRRIANV